MERASKVIRGLRLPGETISIEQLACAAWADAVGKKIALHTRPIRMVRNRLIVEVEDLVWRRQLFTLTGFIVKNLEKSLGAGLVEELEFRVVPTRREPQRAGASQPSAPKDEAEAIDDPVLRSIYRASKKKALA